MRLLDTRLLDMKPKGIFIVLLTVFYLGAQGQTVSKFILTDQFGYRSNAQKTAVIKDPETGFDSGESFMPGFIYRVINATTGESVYEGNPALFNNGETDSASGDKIWWFDFSSVSEPGEYYILDVENQAKSYHFLINDNVYKEALKHAVRTFFYQRAGHEKPAQYAGADWADGASHVGTLQDKNCRLYNQLGNASTERDLHGGWYDAGNYDKFTTWTCNYIESLIWAYLENPEIWTDDYNIPESGNGIPDILDEIRWGLDWLLRMQESNGSVLCIMGLDHASPPSAARGRSKYGPATTTASWAAAKAFAISYKAYRQIGDNEYAEKLKTAAIRAWDWAEQNQHVRFSDPNFSISTLGQDIPADRDYDRQALRITAALYLYEMTGNNLYLAVFENNYAKLTLFSWGGSYVRQYWTADQLMFLYYLTMSGAKTAIKNRITTALRTGFNNPDDYVGQLGKDGYRSFISQYNWASNMYKAEYGLIFYFLAEKSLEPDRNDEYLAAAEDYLHYIHGVNPLGLVYLSNMNKYGASNSVTEFLHSWFAHNTKWDKVTLTTPGPAPGFLTGGPNADYKWNACCPDNCGSKANNTLCLSEDIPKDQPDAKMYKDFNTSWPLDSWALTENSGACQTAYIRLLSKFIKADKNTGVSEYHPVRKKIEVYSNPDKEVIHVRTSGESIRGLELYDMQMRLLSNQTANNMQAQLNISSLPAGIYFVKITTETKVYVERVIVIT